MTTTMLRRGMVFLLVLGMTLAMTVVPAFALATGSASLADDVFFAGTTSRLDVTVTNNATPGGVPLLQPGGSSIDAVQPGSTLRSSAHSSTACSDAGSDQPSPESRRFPSKLNDGTFALPSSPLGRRAETRLEASLRCSGL